jgi:aminopeptidase N
MSLLQTILFDGITYAKGGSVLKQLSAWVGQEQFLAGVAQYFKKHAFGNTEVSDLMVELEATSGRDLSSWTKLWLQTAGVNTLRPIVATDAAGTLTEFAVAQSAPVDWPTIRPHRLAIGFYNLVGGSLERVHRLELDVDGPRTEVPELVGRPRPDLILLNDDDLAYAKIRLDEDSMRVAITHLKSISNPLARSLVWASVWDSTRDAETTASDFIDLVLGNIATETESTTLRTVLGQLQLAAAAYTAPARRQAQLDRIASAMWDLAKEAKAGSDNQFQFLRSFAQVASTDVDLAIVAQVRNGEVALDGLDIDTDLGWDLLIALAAGGAATAAEIDEYLASDNTSTGQQSAAHAHAALPTTAAKEAAWVSAFDSDTAPNTIVRATGMGFLKVNDTSLLDPFVARYFENITGIWKARSFSIASALVTGYYPSPLFSQGLVEATQAWLAANPEEPALRRLVVENLAGIERALIAQKLDANA